MENNSGLEANSILKKRALVGAIILSAAVTAGTFGLWPNWSSEKSRLPQGDNINGEYVPDRRGPSLDIRAGRVQHSAGTPTLMEQIMDDHKLTAAEALYGFMGWLTCREQAVTFGAHHEASTAAELVAEFCKANGLGDVSREDWHKFLTHPK